MEKVKADLHNHLRTSSRMRNFNKTIDVAQKRLGVGGIFGVINYFDSRYENFCNLRGYDRINIGNAIYIPEKKILIVKGQEVPTEQGDVLVIGLKENVHLKNRRSLADTISEAQDNNGVIISCYENMPWLLQHLDYLNKIDGIEIYNSEAELAIPCVTPKNANYIPNEFFTSFQEQYDLGSIVGSDGHSLYELGRSWMQIPALDYQSSGILNDSLRAAIKEKRKPSEEKRNDRYGKRGAVIHAVSLTGCIALDKLGIDFNRGCVPKELR